MRIGSGTLPLSQRSTAIDDAPAARGSHDRIDTAHEGPGRGAGSAPFDPSVGDSAGLRGGRLGDETQGTPTLPSQGPAAPKDAWAAQDQAHAAAGDAFDRGRDAGRLLGQESPGRSSEWAVHWKGAKPHNPGEDPWKEVPQVGPSLALGLNAAAQAHAGAAKLDLGQDLAQRLTQARLRGVEGATGGDLRQDPSRSG